MLGFVGSPAHAIQFRDDLIRSRLSQSSTSATEISVLLLTQGQDSIHSISDDAAISQGKRNSQSHDIRPVSEPSHFD
jgi:hypothetical protein